MFILLNGMSKAVAALLPHPRLGQLFAPKIGQRTLAKGAAQAPVWACACEDRDEGIGGGGRLLARVQNLDAGVRARCKFFLPPYAIAPAATLELFRWWAMHVKLAGLPIALAVGEDMPEGVIPWKDLQAIVLVGSLRFRESRQAQAIIDLARQRGCWIHQASVGSRRQLRVAHEMGCDSICVSAFARFKNRVLLPMLQYLEAFEEQASFFSQSRKAT